MAIEIVNQSTYILIKVIGDTTNDASAVTLSLDVQKMVQETSLKFVLVQCSECQAITNVITRELAAIFKIVRSFNGGLRLVAANKNILEFIKGQGLDRLLVNKLSLRGALVDFGLAKERDFDVNFINPFLSSTKKVLKVQCFMEITPEKPYIKKATDPLLLGDVSGIISINSETFTGTLAISMSEPIFLKVVSNMLGTVNDKIEEKNVDLIGELSNMILGQAKIELMAMGYSIQSALPSCVWGKDHKIKHFGGGQCVVLPFKTEVGNLYIEIMTNNASIESKKPAA